MINPSKLLSYGVLTQASIFHFDLFCYLIYLSTVKVVYTYTVHNNRIASIRFWLKRGGGGLCQSCFTNGCLEPEGCCSLHTWYCYAELTSFWLSVDYNWWCAYYLVQTSICWLSSVSTSIFQEEWFLKASLSVTVKYNTLRRGRCSGINLLLNESQITELILTGFWSQSSCDST